MLTHFVSDVTGEELSMGRPGIAVEMSEALVKVLPSVGEDTLHGSVGEDGGSVGGCFI